MESHSPQNRIASRLLPPHARHEIDVAFSLHLSHVPYESRGVFVDPMRCYCCSACSLVIVELSCTLSVFEEVREAGNLQMVRKGEKLASVFIYI
jgi:hypothetical protein